MNLINNTVKVHHKVFGIILEENFVDETQFQIFLQSLDGALVLKEDFHFFNGSSFLIHVPYEILKESFVFGKSEPKTLIDKIINQSLIEK